MKSIYILILALVVGCANCSQGDNNSGLNIRQQPGSEYCEPMCDLFKSMDCKPYYEDIILENDAGIMTCTEFCLYELKNSIPLNPECIVKNLKSCDQIETICK